MVKQLLTLTFILSITFSCFAATDIPIALEKAYINVHDKASLNRGAKVFAQTCMVCHAMRFLKYNAVAKANGITLDKMPVQDEKWWLKNDPPDLSLAAKVYGPNWLYTYLHSFYEDTSRPLGTNNLLMHNLSMPNPFLGLQGTQVLTVSLNDLQKGKYSHKSRYYSVLRLEKQGSMTPEQFDGTIRDLVNFMVYASDPNRAQREHIGYWVLGFLGVFGVLAFLLYLSYWQEVKDELHPKHK